MLWEPVNKPTTCGISDSGHRNGASKRNSSALRTAVVNLMVMTQSCDLENNKAPFVACCPIYTLVEFEAENPGFYNSRSEELRIGRVDALHPVARSTVPQQNNRDALVVNFRQIFSLPIEYLSSLASAMGPPLAVALGLTSNISRRRSLAFSCGWILPSSIPSYTAKQNLLPLDPRPGRLF